MKLDLSKFTDAELEQMLKDRKQELANLTLNPKLAELLEEIEAIEMFLKKEPQESADGQA
jgi:ribosomal protein L29